LGEDFLVAPFLGDSIFLATAFFVLEGGLGMVDLASWAAKLRIIPKVRQQINSVITLYSGTF
jgi:hypothetical protein